MQREHSHAFGTIDIFRIAAALLVVTIHTSPLTIWSDTADFLFTRVLARVAVPFFLMTTGFFTLGRTPVQKARVATFHFYRRTLVLYATAIALYIPLNVYSGYFAQTHLWQNLLKDLCFDGTFYHLWYLPASLIGMLIVQLLQKCRREGVGWAVVLALYLIGLLGDSYYGMITQSSAVKYLYDAMFTVFDYTRNGLFYAPVFLWMGAWLRRHPLQLSRRACGIALTACFLALCGEALSLRSYGWQRHDSMYLFLLPVMMCLFSLLLRIKRRAPRTLRDLALAVYLVHPWMIVCVRGTAKVLGLTALLIDNSIGHFLAVGLSSLLLAGLYTWGAGGIGRTRQAAIEQFSSPQDTPSSEEEPAGEKAQTAVSSPAPWTQQPDGPLHAQQANTSTAQPQAGADAPVDGLPDEPPNPTQAHTLPAQYVRRFPPRSSRRR